MECESIPAVVTFIQIVRKLNLFVNSCRKLILVRKRANIVLISWHVLVSCLPNNPNNVLRSKAFNLMQFFSAFHSWYGRYTRCKCFNAVADIVCIWPTCGSFKNWDYVYFLHYILSELKTHFSCNGDKKIFLNIFLAKLSSIITTHGSFFYFHGNLIKNVRYFEWHLTGEWRAKKKCWKIW